MRIVPDRSAVSWRALLPRGMQRIGRLLASGRHFPPVPADLVRRGEDYLIARLQAGEIVSRAPAESTNKRFDDSGEAFLALDVVVALGPNIPDAERQKLIARLLESERDGGWVYAPAFGDIDSDTTASALRTLDRLGYDASDRDLDRFMNPRTGLFTTYYGPPYVDPELGLQLPPQSLAKHGGSHPCVLANIYLLLRERRQMPPPHHALLQSIQRPDGNWHSYHYPSPYYSTRLFTELLVTFGSDYDPYLRSTLQTLLTCEPPPSPTQSAEILISLAHLRRRFTDKDVSLAKRAGLLVRHLLATQLEDGSWPGDVIWEYFKTPPIVGFDHFRTRSTALCVHALKLWQSPGT